MIISPYTASGHKLRVSALAKAPAIEIVEEGVVLNQYNPLFDNLNPGALAKPKPAIYGRSQY
jgi:hypothetical protein